VYSYFAAELQVAAIRTAHKLLELPTLLGDRVLRPLHFALPLHPFEPRLSVELPLSTTVFYLLLTLHVLPSFDRVDNRSARNRNGLRIRPQREGCEKHPGRNFPVQSHSF
jgi:hypothetical protein